MKTEYQPLLRKAAVLLGILAGIAVFGFVFGFISAFLGAWIIGGNEYGGFGNLVGAIAGMVIGYPLGIAIAITIIDKVFHYRGWILAGVVGAVLGGVIPMALAEPANLNEYPNLLWALLLVLPPLLALASFSIRKPRKN